jgi:RNA-directed DNA polymerase
LLVSLKMKIDFNSINWQNCNKEITTLQEKLVIAFKKGQKKKVFQLQTLIVKSFSGKALAVKKVITNRGQKT